MITCNLDAAFSSEAMNCFSELSEYIVELLFDNIAPAGQFLGFRDF